MSATPRRGMAPLEFVLVFPLLLGLTAGLFLIARADMTKSFAATDARHRAWAGRPAVPPGQPLTLTADPAASAAAHTTVKPVPPGPLFGGGYRAESRDTVFANPWDARAVPFAPGRGSFNPHLTELGMVAGQVPGLGFVLGAGFAYARFLLDADGFAYRAIAAGGKGLNGVVWVAGTLLAFTMAPAIAVAEGLIEILMIPLRIASWFSSRAHRLLHYLERVVEMMDIGVWAALNLYDASRGRPGNWDANPVIWLFNFRP